MLLISGTRRCRFAYNVCEWWVCLSSVFGLDKWLYLAVTYSLALSSRSMCTEWMITSFFVSVWRELHVGFHLIPYPPLTQTSRRRRHTIFIHATRTGQLKSCIFEIVECCCSNCIHFTIFQQSERAYSGKVKVYDWFAFSFSCYSIEKRLESILCTNRLQCSNSEWQIHVLPVPHAMQDAWAWAMDSFIHWYCNHHLVVCMKNAMAQ